MEQEVGASRIDELIREWLAAKYIRSRSDRTAQSYAEAISRFRLMTQREGYDLLDDDDALERVALVYLLHVRSPGKARISGATFNQRHAILSSFYGYLQKRGYRHTNPLDRIERSREKSPHKGTILDDQALTRRLAAIDRTTRTGRRDYALIEFAVMTGKRDHELRGLNLNDLHLVSDGVMVQWPKLKGGKARDQLYPYPHALNLLAYLREQYGESWAQEVGEWPVWCGLAGNSHGRLTRGGIVYIFKQRLGVSSIHSTRRLIAKLLNKAGAPVTYIQAFLDHEKLDTTQRYLDEADVAINRYQTQITESLQLNKGEEQ